jgi:hypothetical protein
MFNWCKCHAVGTSTLISIHLKKNLYEMGANYRYMEDLSRAFSRTENRRLNFYKIHFNIIDKSYRYGRINFIN